MEVEGRHFDAYYVRTIFESDDGHIWVGTTNGLYEITPGKGIRFWLIEDDASSPSNNVRAVFQDSRKRLWLGTSKGLY
ncbi:MAG: hypothetical protein CUN57_01235, partial [Phototrophicales bacterium]